MQLLLQREDINLDTQSNVIAPLMTAAQRGHEESGTAAVGEGKYQSHLPR